MFEATKLQTSASLSAAYKPRGFQADGSGGRNSLETPTPSVLLKQQQAIQCRISGEGLGLLSWLRPSEGDPWLGLRLGFRATVGVCYANKGPTLLRIFFHEPFVFWGKGFSCSLSVVDAHPFLLAETWGFNNETLLGSHQQAPYWRYSLTPALKVPCFTSLLESSGSCLGLPPGLILGTFTQGVY